MTIDTTLSTVVRRSDVAPVSWSGGEEGRFLLRAEDTDGRFSYYEVSVPPGEGTVLHRHEAMDETFHVLDGTFEIVVGADTHRVAAGTVVYGRRGINHAFRNIGSSVGTLLCITTPGGIEQFFNELSELLHEEPPAGWERLHELATRYDIVVEPQQPPATEHTEEMT